MDSSISIFKYTEFRKLFLLAAYMARLDAQVAGTKLRDGTTQPGIVIDNMDTSFILAVDGLCNSTLFYVPRNIFVSYSSTRTHVLLVWTLEIGEFHR